ncbi:hypothetical protein [Magnaporthe oryzae mymonavirus 1]|nr:hypothetical protein [Magnaporthe oryzae mymonavirus 1]
MQPNAADASSSKDQADLNWNLQVEDELAELNAGKPLPIYDMAQTAQKILSDIAHAEKNDKKTQSENVPPDELSLMTLLEQQDDKVTARSDHNPSSPIQSSRVNPLSEDQESYASQRETGELRETVENLTQQIKDLGRIVDGLLGERKSLPLHLSRLQQSVTAQITLLQDKINQRLESTDLTEPRETIMGLETIKEGITQEIATVKNLASDVPDAKSGLAQPAALTGRKRYRTVK